MKKNPQFFDLVKGENAMKDVLMEMVKDRVEERVNAKERETTVNHIKKMMVNLKFTLEQAMDALSIPQSQQQTYAGLVRQGL